jgi:hypothetical protein
MHENQRVSNRKRRTGMVLNSLNRRRLISRQPRAKVFLGGDFLRPVGTPAAAAVSYWKYTRTVRIVARVPFGRVAIQRGAAT